MKPTPANQPRNGRPPLYPFAELTHVGMGFEFPPGKGRAVASSANTWAKRHAPLRRFAVRGNCCTRIADKYPVKVQPPTQSKP